MIPHDVLSDVFQTLRLRSDVYFTAQFASDYAVMIPAEGKRIRFHLVRDGACWLTNEDGSDPVSLRAGDIAIVPNGVGHVLSDTKGLQPVLLPAVLAGTALDPSSGILSYGTGRSSATVLCGFCAFDEDVRHPIFNTMPDRIVLARNEAATRPSLGTTLRLLCEEADQAQAGTVGILSRLMEIVLVQTLRHLGGESHEGQPHFLSALADRNLSKAMQAMHLRPEIPWTTSLLAQQAGMSRTRFSIKFSASVGEPPMTYLANWRLAKARVMLSDTNLTIDEIGRRCGYQSLSAFTRRFKSVFGDGPGTFRRHLRSQRKAGT